MKKHIALSQVKTDSLAKKNFLALEKKIEELKKILDIQKSQIELKDIAIQELTTAIGSARKVLSSPGYNSKYIQTLNKKNTLLETTIKLMDQQINTLQQELDNARDISQQPEYMVLKFQLQNMLKKTDEKDNKYKEMQFEWLCMKDTLLEQINQQKITTDKCIKKLKRRLISQHKKHSQSLSIQIEALHTQIAELVATHNIESMNRDMELSQKDEELSHISMEAIDLQHRLDEEFEEYTYLKHWHPWCLSENEYLRGKCQEYGEEIKKKNALIYQYEQDFILYKAAAKLFVYHDSNQNDKICQISEQLSILKNELSAKDQCITKLYDDQRILCEQNERFASQVRQIPQLNARIQYLEAMMPLSNHYLYIHRGSC